MNQNYNYLLVFLASFLLSCLFSFFYIKIAKKFNILDRPENSERKIHQQPIPIGGGAAVFLSWLFLSFILYKNNLLIDSKISLAIIVAFFLSSLIMIIAGFFDDKFNLSPRWSLSGPILAIALIMLAGLHINYVTNPLGGIIYIDKIWFGYFSLILTFFWLLGMTYTTKLLDGIDGLASSVSLIASLMIFFVSLSWDVKNSTTSLLSLMLAGALLGFLVWNWHPAKVFLGEGGSTFIGFALGVLAIISGSKIATALLVMSVPILDVIIVIWRRLKNKRPFWQGDNEHLHFKLLAIGLRQPMIVVMLSLFSLCFGLVAIIFSTKIKLIALAIFVVLIIFFSYQINKRLSQKYEKL